MALKEALGFSLKPVRIERDGASAPPETSALAPPSESPGPEEEDDDEDDDDDDASNDKGVVITEVDSQPSGAARLFQATNMDPLADASLRAVQILSASSDNDNDNDNDNDEEESAGSEDKTASESPEAAQSAQANSTTGTEERAVGLPAGRSVYRAIRGTIHWVRTHRALLLATVASTTVAGLLLFFLSVADSEDLPTAEPEIPTPAAPPPPEPKPEPEPNTKAEPKTTNGPDRPADSNANADTPLRAAPENTTADRAPELAKSTSKNTHKPSPAPEIDPWQSAPRAPAGPCMRQGHPKLISSQVKKGFPLEALALPEDVMVLVGTSEQTGEALGLQVNATNLESTVVFREPGARALLGVVPKLKDGKRAFAVDRVSIGGHREWRTLPGPLELALTRTNRGLHLIRQKDYRTVSLWPLAPGVDVSRAQIVRYRQHRFGIAFRRGGSSGDVVIGWLDAKSLRRSALADLPFEGLQIGLPSVALRDGRAVVAAATRHSRSGSWSVEVTTARWRRPSRRIDIPALAPRAGTDRFAPKIVTLSNDRWLVQWTEGTEGQRRVRALTLDGSFAPLGTIIELSPANESAGGGLLAPVDEGLLSLFLVQRGRRFEMWGSTVACD